MKTFAAFIVVPKPDAEPPFEDIFVCERHNSTTASVLARIAFDDYEDAITAYVEDNDGERVWELSPTA